MVHRWEQDAPEYEDEPAGVIIGLLLIVCLSMVIVGFVLARGSLG